jgi:two-component system, NarL family, response regulator NreC
VNEAGDARRETSIRVFLVDDHPVLRGGIRALIDLQDDLRVVGEAGDGRTALRRVEALRPDVVVMDLGIPRLGGIAATEWIKATCPEVEVLALTGQREPGYANLMLAAGAAGFCYKQSSPMDLLEAIRTIAAGGVYLDPRLSAPSDQVC